MLTCSCRNSGGLGNAEAQASAQGRELLNTAIRKNEKEHAKQDQRIEKAAAITGADKQG